MPEFRPYTPDDLNKVLQFLGRCFLENQFTHYHPGDIVHWMSSEYKGENLGKHFWLWEDKGELVAFAELPKAAYASYTLITDPKRCESSLETALLVACQTVMQERMQQNPPDKRVLSTHVAASDRRRLEHLKNLGYQLEPSKRVVALRALELPIPKPALPDGFQLRSQLRSVAGEQEADLVAEVHNRSFGSKWTGAEYLKVMRTPGFGIERELVAATPDGRFATFLIYWLDPISKTGLFEPVGCHKAFQRRGLAKALMYEAMTRMIDAGMTRATVEHYSDNEPAANLYASAGFKEHFKTFDCEFHPDSER